MKKLYAILAVVVLSASAFAQKSIYFGPKFGITIPTVEGTRVEQFKPTADIIGGVFVEKFVVDWFSVSAEVMYAGLGAKVKDENTTLNLNYVKVPLLVNFYPVKGFAITAGFSGSYLTGANFNTDVQRISMNDVIEKIDFAVPVGISYTFDFGLIFGARYNFGVKNILVNEDSLKAYNNYFAFTVGWKF